MTMVYPAKNDHTEMEPARVPRAFSTDLRGHLSLFWEHAKHAYSTERDRVSCAGWNGGRSSGGIFMSETRTPAGMVCWFWQNLDFRHGILRAAAIGIGTKYYV